jgi:hypothetical protein
MGTLANVPPPGEPNKTPRAKDLKNVPMLLKPGQKYVIDGADEKKWTYVECDVVTLDRQGVVGQYEDVRFSWGRTLPQLEERKGQWLACKAIDTGEGIIFVGLEGRELETAVRVIGEIVYPDGQRELLDDDVAPPPDDEDVPPAADDLA